MDPKDKKTLEQKHAEAAEQVVKLTAERDTALTAKGEAETRATAAEEKAVKAEAAAKEANEKAIKAEAAAKEAADKAAAATAEVATLKGEAKTAEQRAAALVAKSGTDPLAISGKDNNEGTTPACENPWINVNTTKQVAIIKTDKAKAEQLQREAKAYHATHTAKK